MPYRRIDACPAPAQPSRALYPGTAARHTAAATRRLAGTAGLRFALLLCATWGLAAGHAGAQAVAEPAHPCGNPFKNHFGPWDYRSAERAHIDIVEKVHFTPGIEAMVKPGTTTMLNMAQDVGYTLNVFPNHHRALLTMARLAEKHLSDPPPGSAHSVECWFDRAIRFRPDDTVVRGLFALQLAKRKRIADAEFHLQAATTAAKDNPLSHYNIGLVYFDIGNHERALEQAHKAIELGMTRPDLPNRLKAVNKWRDPAPR